MEGAIEMASSEDNKECSSSNHCGSCNTRYVLGLLLFLGMTHVLCMRSNLSVAIVAMVNHTATRTLLNKTEEVACPELVTTSNMTFNKNIKLEDGEFLWNSRMQSEVLGSFYYGFTASQIPGGILVQKYGGKWLFGGAVFLTSMLTLLTPASANSGFSAVIAVRVLQGIIQGVIYPSINLLMTRWFPLIERSRVFAIVYGGMPMGVVLGTILSGVITEYKIFGGWPGAFYVFGVSGIVWFLFWIMLVHESPEVHPRISSKEMEIIQKDNTYTGEEANFLQVPWKAILTSIQVWAIVISIGGQYWGFYLILTNMPMFLAEILHYDIAQNGLVSALPSIMQVVFGLVSSTISDKLIQHKILSVNICRKIMATTASVGSGIFFLLMPLGGCRTVWNEVLICAAMMFMGFTVSGYDVAIVDMSPSYAGALTGLSVTSIAVSGFLAPLTVGELTSTGNTVENWNMVFIISGIILISSGIIFDVFGSAKVQAWNNTETKEMPPNEGQISPTEMSSKNAVHM